MYIIASDYVPRSGMSLVDGISAGDGNYCVIGDSRDELVDWLKETTNWTKYAEKIEGATAIGSPTLEQFWESYNKKYLTDYSTEYINISSHEGYNNTLYFPHKENWNECGAYWLATPYSTVSTMLMVVTNSGGVGCGTYTVPGIGTRPLVCLPTNICANKSDGKWTFTN